MLLLDLDDTLLTPAKTVSAGSAEVLWDCKRRGMVVGYATGRALGCHDRFLRGLPVDCLAVYNGAVLLAYDNGIGTVIERNEISFSTGLAVMKSIQAACPQARVGACAEPYESLDWQVRRMDTKEPVPGGWQAVPPVPFQRFRVEFGPEGPVKLDLPPGVVQVTTQDGTSMILHERAHKGNALVRLAAHFGLTPAEVIAFGDDVNDLPMLRAAGAAVAMGNALPEVKAAAGWVTESNERDGVGRWLQEHILGSNRDSQTEH